jgi:hypothetical protein
MLISPISTKRQRFFKIFFKEYTERGRDQDQGKEGGQVCTWESLEGCCGLISDQTGLLTFSIFLLKYPSFSADIYMKG